MWNMTLKQRRRHGELMTELDKLKRNPYAMVPSGYSAGEDEAEDEKYKQVLALIKKVVEELQAIEAAVRDNE